MPRSFSAARLAVLLAAALLSACTALEQSAETAEPSVNTPVPTAVNSDADRRAIYESNGGRTGAQAVPDATPNTLRLGEDAAGIGSRQRVGNLNTNDANIVTPETQMQRQQYDAPPPEIHPERIGGGVQGQPVNPQ